MDLQAIYGVALTMIPFCLSLAILCITLLGWASQWLWPSWPMDLASSFQVQYAIANLILWLLLLRLRWPHRSQAIYGGLLLGFVCISFQAAMLGSSYRPASLSSPPASGLPLKLISVNVHPGMEDYGPLLSLVKQERPDLVLLQEATALSLSELRGLEGAMPYSLNKIPPGDRQPGDKYPPTGTALFSRFPVTAISFAANSPADRAGLLAQVQTVADGPRAWLQLFVVHALVPIRPNFYRQRNTQLAAAFAAVQAAELPAVVMGDFNTALWSPLLSSAKTVPLRPARQGFGILPTWRPNLALPSGLQWLGNLFWVPIDHSYVGPDIAVQDFRLGPDVNSDHLPIIVQLSLPGVAPQVNESSV